MNNDDKKREILMDAQRVLSTIFRNKTEKNKTEKKEDNMEVRISDLNEMPEELLESIKNGELPENSNAFIVTGTGEKIEVTGEQIKMIIESKGDIRKLLGKLNKLKRNIEEETEESKADRKKVHGFLEGKKFKEIDEYMVRKIRSMASNKMLLSEVLEDVFNDIEGKYSKKEIITYAVNIAMAGMTKQTTQSLNLGRRLCLGDDADFIDIF